MSINHPATVWLKCISTVVLPLFVSTPLHADELDELWEVVRNDQGIEISLSEVSRSDYKMFRGEAVISTQAETVMNALTHSDSCSLWRYNCKAFISLGDNYNLLINDLPWPLSDRFVATHNVLADESTLEIMRIPLNELPAEQALNLPEHDVMDGMIEMSEYSGYWKLEEINSNEVNVTFQMHANPAGRIPATVINSGVVNNPFNTLLGLRDHLANRSN